MDAKMYSVERLPGLGSTCLFLFQTFLLIFPFFFFFWFWLLLFFKNFISCFAFIFLIFGPTASISVSEKPCYLEHGKLRSSCWHFNSLDLRPGSFSEFSSPPLTQEWVRWPPDVLSNSKSLHVFLGSWPLEIILKVSINKVETSCVFKTSERLRGHSNRSVSVIPS